jgi:hypothetical protein
MDNIYKIVSNSIIKYLIEKGNLSKNSYLIIKINYFNILGVIDKISIHKKISSSQKIISTIEPKSKKSIKLKEKLKLQSSKKIDFTTRHSKLGLLTIQDWETLKKEYRNLLKSRIKILLDYCSSYQKLTNTIPFFITDSSNGGINLARQSIIKSGKNYIDGYILNGGCELVKLHLDKLNLLEKDINKKDVKSLKLATDFSSIYQVFPTSKSVLQINDCKKMENFIREYTNKRVINWKKLILDYEGILVNYLDCNNSKKIFLKDIMNMGYVWRLNKTKFVKVI